MVGVKNYLLKFGSGNPQINTGLSPTFILFEIGPTLPWTGIASPAIAEISSGSGIYTFPYQATLPIAFIADGGAILSSTDRYITGILDPIQAVDTYVGFPGASIGSTAVDPSTLFGYAGRNQEFEEGTANLDKSTGMWLIKTRGGTTFQSRVLTNSSGSVTKS